MKKVDHTAAAEKWIENAIEAQSSVKHQNNEQLAMAYATIAQAHANLALAEQQRAFNLMELALFDYVEDSNVQFSRTLTTSLEGAVEMRTEAAKLILGEDHVERSR